VTIRQAQNRMSAVGVTPLPAGLPETRRESTRLEPISTWVVGETRPSLALLAALAALLLVMTCLTVANMLFVRVTERRRELAVRMALGADQSHITRLLLSEGIVLSGAGTATGIVMALLIQPLVRTLVPSVVPRADEIGVNAWTIVFAVSVGFVTVVLTAMAPAWRSGRFDVASTLKGSSSTISADASTKVLRRAFLAIQASVAAVLLVGAALLLVSFWRLSRVPLGFDAHRVLTVEMRLLGQRFRNPGAIRSFQDAVTSRVAAVPGVLEVGLTSAVPFRGVDFLRVFNPRGEPSRRQSANVRHVDAAFFSVMRIPLLAGRVFDATDTATSPKVVVVSENFARLLFGTENPIGRQLAGSDAPTIIGIVGDLRYVSRHKVPVPGVYFSRSQSPNELICIVARTGSDLAVIGPSIRRAIHEIDPSVPTMNVTTIDRIISDSVSSPRFLTVSTTAFSMLALGLTLIGLGVLIARAVVEREREMAIRSALGAPARSLIGLLLLEGLWPVAVGTTVGLAAAFVGASVLAQFLFDITPRAPMIYIGVAMIIIVLAMATCLLLARRVVTVAPETALRAE
jgi:putative ABC transport system permease protein